MIAILRQAAGLKRRRPSRAAPTSAPAAQQARIAEAFGRGKVRSWWLAPAISAVWLLAAAYYTLMPPVYHSRWSFILPAAYNGSTVSLDSIGQTSSSPSHPFSSVTLSPKVIYKEIATSDQVREAAAKSLGIAAKRFGKPRVQLIDETSLIMFRIDGNSPEQAQVKAQALMRAFEAELVRLRNDEQEKRALLVRDNLKFYKANLDNVRAKMRAFQRESGLISLDQFKEAMASEELLRRKLTEARGDRARLVSEQRRLIAQLGLTPEVAATVVRLASDQAFEHLARSYSEERAKLQQAKLLLGPNHPRMRGLKLKVKSLFDEIGHAARGAGVSAKADLHSLVFVVNKSNQSELLRNAIANESAIAGRNNSIRAISEELSELEVKVARLGKAATEFEALRKDHLVAEAVFTSAAARLDIGRTDIFASYPMVQVLAQPNLPENASQPRLLYALAAALLGTLCILLAWGAIWIRAWFGPKR